ncbi:hypothetical protein BpOF4_22009 (plasmid) [Alkalihalophilus pseudofirmus OF4]|uniref:Uncharacterized protein n=1 Tax=Alkalihalophilus pseudofirmus (strain ATCC BAA-2126 / JCM 17055 / OF4) TaxID=398511 RepID=D3G221_ALKPO|nr:hypothetical protein BpOF4_22009 [Alkalihalophilus pseudofirmus OF4]
MKTLLKIEYLKFKKTKMFYRYSIVVLMCFFIPVIMSHNYNIDQNPPNVIS